MSLIPRMRYGGWWDDLDSPSSLFDQHFGIGLRHDTIPSVSHSLLRSMNSPLLRTGYYRPWRDIVQQTSGSSNVQVDKDNFQVILDVQQFAPEEVTVKAVNNVVVVEGKHEEKQDEHGFISRHFVRKYMLPSDVKMEDITSSLSSDGVLTICAPKKTLPPPPGERSIPIQQTGIPAVKPTVTAPTSPGPSSSIEIPVTHN